MPSLRKYVFNLAAGASDKLDVDGPLLSVLDSSTPFLLSLDNAAPIPAERGLKFRWPFKAVSVQNPTASAIVITLLIGDADIEDYRPQVKQQIASRSRTAFAANVTVTGTPWTLVEAADETRVEVVLHSPSTNTGFLKLFSEAANGSSCFGIAYPGQVFRINYKGPVYIGTNVNPTWADVFTTYYV